ncbi:MAG: HAD hydrolase-like protein [Desulfobacterales bacterium]|nr:HAD hydrolase-like protein [Desulfobacterales bacterium]
MMDVLIFDMDGVLIDVSKSYRKTIQRTIQIYLETCLGFARSRGSWITNDEISLFKSVGGFNNDWDLTSGLLLYLLSISGISFLRKLKRFSSIQETLSYLKTKSSTSHWKPHPTYLKFPRPTPSPLTGEGKGGGGQQDQFPPSPSSPPTRGGETSGGSFLKVRDKRLVLSMQESNVRLKRRNLSSFLDRVRSKGGGLRGIRRILGTSWQGWVYGAGDLEKENLVKRIFQELYLGKQFAPYYHLRPIFYTGKGLYEQERLLISKEILSSLRRKVRMGIASGRPRVEAELALNRFHLRPYFDSVVTLDECTEEENRIFRSTGKKTKCSKPHPYSILKAVQEIGISNPRCGYVGDVVDDMGAARAAKRDLSILAVGFTRGDAKRKVMKDSLIKAGADLVIESQEELLRLVS